MSAAYSTKKSRLWDIPGSFPGRSVLVLQPKSRIGRFEVQGMLGRGGMADVYQVLDLESGLQRALKVLTVQRGLIGDRMRQEGKVQFHLRHPNLVEVLEVIDVNGRPGLVMECVKGPTLLEILKLAPPSPDEVLAIFRALLVAVHQAHRHDVVHRDLKPSNVLIRVGRAAVLPKVADFGIAKVLNEELAGDFRTRTGTLLGTPMYMAPEQSRDASKVDKRADLYSLGCILYAMLCRFVPFRQKDAIAQYKAREQAVYRPVSEVVPGLPQAIEQAISACLEPDVERRVPDCAALFRLLQPHLAPDAAELNDVQGPQWVTGSIVENARLLGAGERVPKAKPVQPEWVAPKSPVVPAGRTWGASFPWIIGISSALSAIFVLLTGLAILVVVSGFN